MLYFYLLIAIITLPAGILLIVNIINSKKGEPCKTEKMEMAAVSKLKFDDSNVIRQNSNAFLLSAAAFIAILLIVAVVAITGGVDNFNLTSCIFFGLIALASQYLLFSYFNFAFYMYEDFFVYRNVLRKTFVCKYRDVEISKANRLVVAHFNKKKISIYFDCVNIEKFLQKCGIPKETMEKYGTKERYKVNKVSADDLLKKKRGKNAMPPPEEVFPPAPQPEAKKSNSKEDKEIK